MDVIQQQTCPSGRLVTGRIVLSAVVLFLALFTPASNLAASRGPFVPARDPNSVVPPPMNSHMDWSEEGGWHWVTISHDGTRRLWNPNYDVSIGKSLPRAYFVATRVRTLSADDPCDECVSISHATQGPPIILDGPKNALLAPAYANIENGPRRKIREGNGEGGGLRWTEGAWYLNYSPITNTFFSWTWIPADWNLDALQQGTLPDTSPIPLATPTPEPLQVASLDIPVPANARVFPVVGHQRVSQAFGCVPPNHGYPSSDTCPSDTPSFHSGVDIAAPAGSPILAAASGTVTFVGIDPADPGRNTRITIEHYGPNEGFRTVYLHWRAALVTVGDRVTTGQPIAEVGSVGYSTGPHLHFVVVDIATGASVDPVRWLDAVGADLPGTAVLRWTELIIAAAKTHDVPPALIAAIMTVESSGNPDAVSPAGAIGLMQIMPEHLTRFGIPKEMWHDPAVNIDAGARYLAEVFQAGGSLEDAIARYFGQGCDVLGTCTEDYVARVLEWHDLYQERFP